MKTPLISLFLALGLMSPVYAEVYLLPNPVIIPDGDLNGYQNSQTVSGLQESITHVSVTLNVSGGFNGDLYAYVYHNNTMAVLLNRVGRSATSSVGYPDRGFGPDASQSSFTFDDLASHDVHFYRTFGYTTNSSGQLTGQWQPDGRNMDPQSPGSAFAGAVRANTLSVFNNMNPNGVWMLFIADVSPGFESSLVNWGLDITAAVPEPTSLTLLGVLGASLGCAYLRRRPTHLDS